MIFNELNYLGTRWKPGSKIISIDTFHQRGVLVPSNKNRYFAIK